MEVNRFTKERPHTPHLKRLNWATPFCEPYVEVWHTLPSLNRWTYPTNPRNIGQKVGSLNPKRRTRTHPPPSTFSRARSTARCQIPLPRNVSMTCPFRKNAERMLKPFHEVFTPPILSKRETHGLVKQISAAPIDQRVVLESKYVAVGRTPHITGSSSLTGA